MKSQISNLKSPRGFTVIELLVVIGIIILLLGIIAAGGNYFRKVAAAAAAKLMGDSMKVGLAQFYKDHNDTYPSSNAADYTSLPMAERPLGLQPSVFAGWNGGEILTQALLGTHPNDNKTGYGFSLAVNTRVYGPYIDIKNDRQIEKSPLDDATEPPPYNRHILTMPSSKKRSPFLYYTANNVPAAGTGADFAVAATAVWGGMMSRFNTAHNAGLTTSGTDPVKYWKEDQTSTAAQRESFAVSLRAAPYLIAFPGPDDTWGGTDDIFITGP